MFSSAAISLFERPSDIISSTSSSRCVSFSGKGSSSDDSSALASSSCSRVWTTSACRTTFASSLEKMSNPEAAAAAAVASWAPVTSPKRIACTPSAIAASAPAESNRFTNNTTIAPRPCSSFHDMSSEIDSRCRKTTSGSVSASVDRRCFVLCTAPRTSMLDCCSSSRCNSARVETKAAQITTRTGASAAERRREWLLTAKLDIVSAVGGRPV